MKIPGFLTDTLFYLRTLTIISVSSIALQTFVVVRGKSESDWKRYYGSSKELADDVATQGKVSFKRDIISLHKSKGLVNFEETRQLFINNVLTESMDDGTPAFYNSNILGRYMRKDYFKP
jgi:hypothetical protein